MIIDCLSCGAPWDTSVKTHTTDADMREPDADRIVVERYGIACPACGQRGVFELFDSRARLLRIWNEQRGAA